MKTLYKSEPISDVSDAKEVALYLRRELEAIEEAFGNALPREIDWLHVAPTKVREGLTVGADGTDWNPGAGQGVYTYYNATWNRLG